MRDRPWWAGDPDYDPGVTLVNTGKDWAFLISPEIYEATYSVARMIDTPPEKAEKELKSVIKKYPYIFTAYNMLAEVLHSLGRDEDAIDALKEGLWRAKELFPDDFVLGKSSLPWSLNHNRSFLTMYQSLGELLLLTDTDAAKEVLENLLHMDPWSDPTTQDLVCKCYFMRGEYEAMLDFCNKYYDNLITQSYCSILALFKMGRIKEARSLLKDVICEEKYLPAMLINGGPGDIFDEEISPDACNYALAYIYWDAFGDLWDKESRDFLRREAKRSFYSSRAGLQSYT